MTPSERRHLTPTEVRNRWYRKNRHIPDPEPEEPIPLEVWFDESLTGIDKQILEELGVEI